MNASQRAAAGKSAQVAWARIIGWTIPWCVVVASGPVASGHEFSLTHVTAGLERDGVYVIDMQVDVDALALGVSPSVPSEELAAALRAMSADAFEAAKERARGTILRRVRVRFDGDQVTPEISFPGEGQPPAADAEPTVLGIIARLSGEIPEGTGTFSFGASRAFKVVQLTVYEARTDSTQSLVLDPGEESPPIELGSGRSTTGVQIFAQYVELGFEHILPKGLDHILFILALFLLQPKIGPLLWQVTAFTVAHSVTLALAMLDVVTLPASVVEPLIAVSIAFVAIENLFVREMKWRRPVIVFAFGLLHGLGFAGVLLDLGTPRDSFLGALVGFNLGVEFGQLAVVMAAAATIGLLRGKPWYRSVVTIPLSLLIAVVGLYWAVERTLGA